MHHARVQIRQRSTHRVRRRVHEHPDVPRSGPIPTPSAPPCAPPRTRTPEYRIARPESQPIHPTVRATAHTQTEMPHIQTRLRQQTAHRVRRCAHNQQIGHRTDQNLPPILPPCAPSRTRSFRCAWHKAESGFNQPTGRPITHTNALTHLTPSRILHPSAPPCAPPRTQIVGIIRINR